MFMDDIKEQLLDLDVKWGECFWSLKPLRQESEAAL